MLNEEYTGGRRMPRDPRRAETEPCNGGSTEVDEAEPSQLAAVTGKAEDAPDVEPGKPAGETEGGAGPVRKSSKSVDLGEGGRGDIGLLASIGGGGPGKSICSSQWTLRSSRFASMVRVKAS